MNKIAFFIACLFFTLTTYAQEGNIVVRVIQNNQEVVPEVGVLKLEKKPFRIQLELTNLEGVYLYADVSDSLFRLEHSQPIPGYSNLSSLVIKEDKFNAKKQLAVSRKGWSFWFYDKKTNENFFDKDIQFYNKEILIAKKTINQVYFPDTKKTVSVEQMNQPLYLFFVTTEHKGNGSAAHQEQPVRVKLKITWK